MSRLTHLLLLPFLLTLYTVRAHEGHDELSEEEATAAVDSILWIHIFLQASVWGILFPIGMVFGLSRNRWHVPLQAAGILLTLGGYLLGHAHGGRQFLRSAHSAFAKILLLPIAAQFALGVYLRLHIHERTLRPWAVRAHGFVGRSYPVLGWTQMLFGAIAFRGYCHGEELGQCLAHYIMGSGFIAYGIILAILLLVGEGWIRKSGRSPDWWDSWVILAWGIVNTFTEHRGSVWSVKDMQHTILGILWWCGGLLGVYLSRNNQRTVAPSIIIVLTGWAMSDHAQALMLSTKVHAVFGYTLMSAGLTRMIEVCFVAPSYAPTATDGVEDDRSSDHTLADGAAAAMAAPKGRAFRHLPPFLLVAAGLLFMSATDEQLQFVHEGGMDHVTYILIMFSMAFLLYTHVVFLITLYATSDAASSSTKDDTHGAIELTSTPTSARSRRAWYSRVRTNEPAEVHVIGNDDEDED